MSTDNETRSPTVAVMEDVIPKRKKSKRAPRQSPDAKSDMGNKDEPPTTDLYKPTATIDKG